MSADIVATVKLLDTDNDGLIDATEARHLFENLKTRHADLGLTDDKYQEWFNSLDIDRDGNVTVDEVVAYLTTINYPA